MDMMWPDVPSGDIGFSLGANGLRGGPVVKNLSANTGGMGSFPGLGRSPGEGQGNPLQYSCLGNPMNRGAWRAVVQGVKESDTTCRLSTHTCIGS